MMKRRKEREFVLQLLYAREMNDLPLNEHFETQKQYNPQAATPFSFALAEKCQNNRDALDDMIQSKLQHWEFERLAILDRILLRMALAEFIYFEDIPPEVTMDEMIEISKSYSTERSSKFINGMLDALLKQLKQENKIFKTGRGRVSKVL